MKLIVAIIQPDKFEEVHQALIDNEIIRITVGRVTGHGRQENVDLYRGQEVTPDLIPKVRLEIAVNDEFVKPTLIEGVDGTVRDGDVVTIDSGSGTLAVDAPEIDSRTGLEADVVNRQVGMGRELFAIFRENSQGAEQGAGIFTVADA